MISMGKYASEVVKQAQSWIGKKESDGSHKSIIDLYNNYKPLARNYKVKYTDAWCATFGSAVAIKLGYTDIIPTECGCGEQIKLWQKLGCWVENDGYTPKAGDYIYYDWDDSGKGDNTGWSDHVGIVEKVSNGEITVIEGNYNNTVGRRVIKVNAKYIRGYGVPKYDAEPVKQPAKTNNNTNTSTTSANTKTAKSYAEAMDEKLAGTYTTTANLHLRDGAGTNYKSLVIIPKGTKVKCYGYYSVSNGQKWLYIQATVKGVKYTGFSCKAYLTK